MAGHGSGIWRHAVWRRFVGATAVGWAAACVAGAGVSVAERCGDVRANQPYSLPCSVVASVDGESISTTEYGHWFAILARSGGTSVAPDPPRFTKCIAAKRKTLRGSRHSATRKQLERQCDAEFQAIRQQAMQLLISFAWVHGEAEDEGITVSAAEVREDFREQKWQAFPKQKDYEKFLRQSGQTEADLLKRVELDLLSEALRDRATRDVAPVTDRAIERYYNDNRSRFTQPERRDLLVVLTAHEREAEAARARIEAGEPWARVAGDVSLDAASKSRGGKLRGVAKGQQERALDRALFGAPRGELRGPIKTQFGWYVFKITRIRPARQLSFERARRTIEQLLIARGKQHAVDAFVAAFNKRWTAVTICRKGYRTTDCANGPGSAASAAAQLAGRIPAD